MNRSTPKSEGKILLIKTNQISKVEINFKNRLYGPKSYSQKIIPKNKNFRSWYVLSNDTFISKIALMVENVTAIYHIINFQDLGVPQKGLPEGKILIFDTISKKKLH